ncbi:hypothetical protein ABZV91_07830 [Nocardia sp. NPDC004568]|uniref:hypothetical protein n=1 Tax=Nocardia sp. NPDC004568 TaxID=3154551 RepID=UPI0033B2E337
MSPRIVHPNTRPQIPPRPPPGGRTGGSLSAERPDAPRTDDRSVGSRLAGLDRGTLLLAVGTCLLFGLCVTAISHSAVLATTAVACMATGVAAVLVILRPPC